MNTAHYLDTARPARTMAAPKPARTKNARRFCPSMFCLTGEITVRRVSTQAGVWLLIDEDEGNDWLMIGDEPTCPHCGATLL